MLWSHTEQFRNLSYLERPSSTLQCLDEFHRNTPFLANEEIGTPITSKTRPGFSQCLILLCLGLIAQNYIWGFVPAPADSADRPPLAHVPAREKRSCHGRCHPLQPQQTRGPLAPSVNRIPVWFLCLSEGTNLHT